jgi:hypothetical protein
VNQVDEGGVVRINLPFEFPFFRTSTRVVYVSPNGVVYLHEPKNPDYQVARRAPNNSIAALHADLTPRKANHGVRAQVTASKVTVMWKSEHYGLVDQGPVTVRLTLYPSGLIVSSVAFDQGANPSELSRWILGDAWASPPILPLGLIGASASSSRLSSTLNIPDAQRNLTSGSGQQLDLQVVMVPNCFAAPPPETELTVAKVDQIKLSVVKGKGNLKARFVGSGSGKVVVTGSINRKVCPQIGLVDLSNGSGQVRLKIPQGATRIGLRTPTDVRSSVSIRSQKRSVRKARFSQMCSQLMGRLAR